MRPPRRAKPHFYRDGGVWWRSAPDPNEAGLPIFTCEPIGVFPRTLCVLVATLMINRAVAVARLQ